MPNVQLRKCVNHPYLFDGAEPGPPYTTDEHIVQVAFFYLFCSPPHETKSSPKCSELREAVGDGQAASETAGTGEQGAGFLPDGEDARHPGGLLLVQGLEVLQVI